MIVLFCIVGNMRPLRLNRWRWNFVYTTVDVVFHAESSD